MKPKTLILMVVAVVCGLGASYMTSRLLAERGDTQEDDKVFVLVAKKNLEMGTQVKKPEDMFVPKPFIKGQEPKNAITKFEDLKDRSLKRPLREGDWIAGGDLLEPGAGMGVAYSLPKGMRAVGLRVNMENGAAGFATLPMSRVDIVSTVRRGSDTDTFSQVLLENVLVLAADQETKRDPDGRAMPAGVVTVALTPDDALKVTLGREIGTLSLLLRKFNDNERSDTKRMTVRQMMTNESSQKQGEIVDATDFAVKPAPPPPQVAQIPDIPAAPAPKIEPVVVEPQTYTHVVRIIEGDQQRQQAYLFDRTTHAPVDQSVTRSEPGFQPQPLPPLPSPAPQAPQPQPENRPEEPQPNRPQPPQAQPDSGT